MELGTDLYRETLDADLGVPPLVVHDLDIADRLKAAGFRQVVGDRFERPVLDIPAGLGDSLALLAAAAVATALPRRAKPRRPVATAGLNSPQV